MKAFWDGNSLLSFIYTSQIFLTNTLKSLYIFFTARFRQTYCIIVVWSCGSMQIHTGWRQCTDTLPHTFLDCSGHRYPESLSACALTPESHVPHWNTSHYASMRNFINEQMKKGQEKKNQWFANLSLKKKISSVDYLGLT